MLTGRHEWLRLLVLVPALATLALGVAGLLAAHRLGSINGYPVLYSSTYGGVLVVCGLMLLAARYRRSVTALMGVLTLAVLGLVLVASWWTGSSLGGRAAAVCIAAVLAVGGAVAAIFLGRAPPLARFHEQQSLIAAIAGVALSVAAAYSIVERDLAQATTYMETTAQNATRSVAGSLYDIVSLMHRMGERWNVVEHAPSEALIQREFTSYLRDLPSIGSLSLVDASGHIVRAHQRSGASPGWDASVFQEESVQAWLADALKNSYAHFAPLFSERSDGIWGLVATRVTNPEVEGDLILAQVNVSRVLGEALSGNEAVAYFRVSAGDQSLYETARSSVDRDTPTGRITLDAPHVPAWTLSYYLDLPELSIGLAGAEMLPEVYLILGLGFTLAIAASLRFSGIARDRSLALEKSAITDDLTGLPNRRRLEQLLQEALQQVWQDGTTLAVVLFNIGSVRLINESLGHAVGDAVLAEASRRLGDHAPASGTVARLGDDDFIAILHNFNEADVEDYVQRMIDILTQPYRVADRVLRATLNVGYTLTSDAVRDPMQLIRESDLAMLAARQLGRNTVQRYAPEMNRVVKERLELFNALQGAVESGGLALHYQPVISGTTARIVAVEALLRWNHAKLGAVAPPRFLPLAEETGLILPITDWVLATACRDIRRLRERGFPEFAVVVNVSPRYFGRADFVDRVQRALEAESLLPENLAIEITEGVLLENEAAAIRKLHALREMGIGTAIDDFGTGYSSLSYLKNLPVDKVKIDRSFIDDIVSDAPGAAITRGIISMAHHLGLRVVAEGVETDAQYAFLRRSRCDEFQGYLFARPMAFDMLKACLSKNGCRVALPESAAGAESDRVLLLVDDERNVLNALTRLFRREGYRILTTDDPQQAFEILARHPAQVIVSDQRMPGMTGTEFFSKVKDLYPETIRIVLSGYTDLKTVTEAVNHGSIYKFLTKPWDDDELRSVVARAFEEHGPV